MSYEEDFPVAVIDIECNPNYVVIRYATVKQAEWFIGQLASHGGTTARDKVARGGYAIDAPEGTAP